MGRNLPRFIASYIIYHVVLREFGRSVRGFEREDKARDNGIIKIRSANSVNHIKQSSSPVSLCTEGLYSTAHALLRKNFAYISKVYVTSSDKCRICSKKIYWEGKKNLVL